MSKTEFASKDLKDRVTDLESKVGTMGLDQNRATDLNVNVTDLYNRGIRFYTQLVPSNALNIPSNAGAGYYVLFIWDVSLWATQLFIAQDSQRLFIRRHTNNGIWEAWSEFAKK